MDVTERFSNRVSDYVKYRPDYPPALLACLQDECGLTAGSSVADVGSGTGKLTELLLAGGATVHAIEPNREMRGAAEALLRGRKGFISVDGTAEATTLPDASADMVTAGQAYHWFRPRQAAEEFRRILRRGGFAVLAWNDRDPAASPFLGAYDRFLREFSVDYSEVNHHATVNEEGLAEFFGGGFAKRTFPNPRRLDFEGLLGGYLSASYGLTREHPRFPEARERLEDIFDRYAVRGALEFPLRTRSYFARMSNPGAPRRRRPP
jgi:SAM-dependent methyltransferase